MATAISWIKAARLRTLPLALSGIITSSGIALLLNTFNISVCILAALTAISLQIFSNFANDYGDYNKGTDNINRVGPTRTMQNGEITTIEMKVGMIVSALVSLFLGITLIHTAKLSAAGNITFLTIGILALLAAYFYTAGKYSYGYIGLGDLSVFIFFGLISVSALFFLYAKYFNGIILFPAIGIGCLATGVLNLNNMRDIENDKKSNKITLAVKLGLNNAKVYHYLLIFFALTMFVAFNIISYKSIWQEIYILAFPFFFRDILAIRKISNPSNLDPFLKRLSLSTLLLSTLFLLGIYINFLIENI